MNKVFPTSTSKQLAWLIDPDKTVINPTFKEQLINFPEKHIILVGGSTGKPLHFKKILAYVYQYASCLVLIFPGNNTQLDTQADGILLLSLVSGRNPDYIIGQHVEAAQALKVTKLTILPTGYLLLDGGIQSATSQVTQTNSIHQEHESLIVNTALAATQLGMTHIYLEAGSGALVHVNNNIIFKVKQTLTNQVLWVGGGIKTIRQVKDCFKHGANVVVIGNAIEQNPALLTELFKYELVFDFKRE